VKSTDEVQDTESLTVQSLKEELKKQQEAMALNATYLAELESRLETSDDRIEDLTRQVADLEMASEIDQVAVGQRSTENVTDDVGQELAQTVLDEKNDALRELQLQYDEATRECALLVKERDELRAANKDQEVTRRQLEQRLVSLSSNSPRSEIRQDTVDDTLGDGDLTAKVPGSPVPSQTDGLAAESDEAEPVDSRALTRDHAKTLEELSIVKAQYQEALKKLSALDSKSEDSGVSDLASDVEGQEAPTAESDRRVSMVKGESAKNTSAKQGRNNKSQSDGSPITKDRSDFQVGRGQSKVPTAYVQEM
jgi:chromosome segregation ATPase